MFWHLTERDSWKRLLVIPCMQCPVWSSPIRFSTVCVVEVFLKRVKGSRCKRLVMYLTLSSPPADSSFLFLSCSSLSLRFLLASSMMWFKCVWLSGCWWSWLMEKWQKFGRCWSMGEKNTSPQTQLKAPTAFDLHAHHLRPFSTSRKSLLQMPLNTNSLTPSHYVSSAYSHNFSFALAFSLPHCFFYNIKESSRDWRNFPIRTLL